jgi:hypothetical protein
MGLVNPPGAREAGHFTLPLVPLPSREGNDRGALRASFLEEEKPMGGLFLFPLDGAGLEVKVRQNRVPHHAQHLLRMSREGPQDSMLSRVLSRVEG